ncbi:Abi family protein [Paenibacillus rhizoplanae]
MKYIIPLLLYCINKLVNNEKNKSISSYLDKHTYLPMWILTNIMTFGNVSKLFEILTSDVQLLVFR